ncbi:MAG TPA: copper-binding protein [Noviherbaspirillum sp.]|uniref:copper-binding protein n=1 Tax=Noviherbaspirillum sp. TaxID=1926288 RepID=UPI002D3B5A8B|nr:copper-binding protein [Noviherbaspirillum sp.]HYD96479.1 copper-binding protein [Noviherbaspirillum sp.]
MRTLVSLAAAVAFGLSFVLPAGAQHHNHDSHRSKPSGPVSEGVVRKVDKAAKKVTIKHGDLKNLGMGPMTMAFSVLDPTQLERLAVSDKVNFVAEMVGGKLTVTMIEVVN